MEKLARICWNTNDWKRPSGREGKSREKGTYECVTGFGHEEWLLDDTKIMPDGYHYAFLQPMNQDLYRSKNMEKYNIHLFTYSPNKKAIYIGCLCNAVGVSPERSVEVYNFYKKSGWLKDMKNDLSCVGCKAVDFTEEFMFNVKFKFSETQLLLSNPRIINDQKGLRYSNLMNIYGGIQFEKDADGRLTTLNTNAFWRTNKFGHIIIDPLHKKMQNAVLALLKKDYVNLCLEQNYIDMKGQPLNDKGSWHYFEFKTYSTKRCIREAMGQIMEYAHYPAMNKAKKLFIIGLSEPDEQDIIYLKFLRETYHLPLWYRWYSFEENKLDEEV